MCVIAASPIGARQPTESELHSMWIHNPHGGGYMTVRNGKVEIHKGFLHWVDFARSVRSEHFTNADPVVYHFRISTQGGVNPEMTHPFPLSHNLEIMKALDVICSIGVAHNGIIPLTSSVYETNYSDTALFVAHYMSNIIRCPNDIRNPYIKRMIDELGKSKFALMDSDGNITTIGKFFDDNGVLLSNENHLFNWNYSAPMKGEKSNVLCF